MMETNSKMKSVVVAGGGAGGLAAAWGLAKAGFEVVILERGSRLFGKQSGLSGGQARYHSGAYYHNSPEVARAIYLEDRLRREIPGAVVPTDAHYFVSKEKLWEVIAGWQAAGIPFRRLDTDSTPLAARFRRSHKVVTYLTEDQVIDCRRVEEFLLHEFTLAGGQVCCGARVVGSQRHDNRLVGIQAQTDSGLRRYPCDFFVNVTGAALADVACAMHPMSKLGDALKLIATPVLQTSWPFPQEPAILQLYGGLLDHLSLIPVGAFRRMVSIATWGGNAVDTAIAPSTGLELERQRLTRLVAAAFDIMELPEPVSIRYCVKAHLEHPNRRHIESSARLVTLISGAEFGGCDNEVIGSPGKLSNCLAFRDAVVHYAADYFGGQREVAA